MTSRNLVLYTLRPELLHFVLLYFAFKKVVTFCAESLLQFALKKLLHFASEVVTIQVSVIFCVKICYILR